MGKNSQPITTQPASTIPPELEERLRQAQLQLATRIADREDAKKAGNQAAVNKIDNTIVESIHNVANAAAPINPVAGGRLHAEAANYQKANSSGKDRIALRLAGFAKRFIIQKIIGVAVLAALTGVGTWAIIQFGEAGVITDGLGNVTGEAVGMADTQGGYDVYEDTNADGIMDVHYDDVQQKADGSYDLENANVDGDTGCCSVFFEWLCG